MAIDAKFVRELAESITALSAFARKFEHDELIDPPGTATGYNLHICVVCAKLVLQLGVGSTDDDVSETSH